MRRLLKLLLSLIVLYVAGCVIGGILLAEMQLHPSRRLLRHADQFAQDVTRADNARITNVTINAADGVILRAWYVNPPKDNGNAVLLLHGVGDNREGVRGYAQMFLAHGYRVLMPDSRAHGESGGELATYGLLESDDIHRWVDWLESARPHCVYGFGESMGAALLLQSLAREPRYCAVAVESSFARFQEVAPERTARYSRMPFWFGKTFERPVITVALAYTRHKCHLDFRKANPADALAHSNVPVLLIAGTADLDILPHHSKELAKIGRHAELWMVQGAAHGGAWDANPELFERKVTGFFAAHE